MMLLDSLTGRLQSGEMLLLQFCQLLMKCRLMTGLVIRVSSRTTMSSTTTSAELGKVFRRVNPRTVFGRVASAGMVAASSTLTCTADPVVRRCTVAVGVGQAVRTRLRLFGILETLAIALVAFFVTACRGNEIGRVGKRSNRNSRLVPVRRLSSRHGIDESTTVRSWNTGKTESITLVGKAVGATKVGCSDRTVAVAFACARYLAMSHLELCSSESLVSLELV